MEEFTLDLTNLGGFVYDLDGGPLGDGTTGAVEGIAASDPTYSYVAGPGPFEVCGIGLDCARVAESGATPGEDFSQQLLVQGVPQQVPSLSLSGLLLLTGFFIFMAYAQATYRSRVIK